MDAFNFFKKRYTGAGLGKLLSIWFQEHYPSLPSFFLRLTWKGKRKFVLPLVFLVNMVRNEISDHVTLQLYVKGIWEKPVLQIFGQSCWKKITFIKFSALGLLFYKHRTPSKLCFKDSSESVTNFHDFLWL